MNDEELRDEIEGYMDELVFVDFGNGAFGMFHPDVLDDLKGMPNE